MTPEQYLALVTMHGTIMVFFVLTTAPQSAFGNYFLPIQIGAPEMAFPCLNMLSFWLTLAAFLCVVAAFAVPGGAPISGWTAYPPLSGLGEITGPGRGAGPDAVDRRRFDFLRCFAARFAECSLPRRSTCARRG